MREQNNSTTGHIATELTKKQKSDQDNADNVIHIL